MKFTIVLVFLTINFSSYSQTILKGYAKGETMAAKVFPYDKNDMSFPEEEYLIDKKNIGLVFSGGGSRSASLTIGQLRALNMLELMDNIKYISSVSGGSWAATVYSYYKGIDSVLLGEYIPPHLLQVEDLRTVTSGSFLEKIVKKKGFRDGLYAWHTGEFDNSYAYLLNAKFLSPFQTQLGNQKLFFTYKDENALEISQRPVNKIAGFKQDGTDFLTMNERSNRPYLIVGGTIVKRNVVLSKPLMLHLEMTPLYSGVSYDGEQTIGGGYIESFGFDSHLTKNFDSSTALANVKLNKKKFRFNLSDVMAISGYAPGTSLAGCLYYPILSHLGGPEMHFWKISQQENSDINSKEFVLGDGGNLENVGLLPLIKRRVDKVVVFINSKKELNPQKQQRISGDTILNQEVYIDRAILRLFGIVTKETKEKTVHVLENRNGEFHTFFDTLYALKAHCEPLIFQSTYNIVPQPKYDILPTDEYNTIEILWVYNDGTDPYFKKMKDKRIKKVSESLGNTNNRFPHLPTISTKLIQYSPEEANLLSQWASWIIMHNKAVFEDFINN